MIRLYETIILYKADLSDEEIDNQVKRIEELVARFQAEIVRIRKWGKKRLAFDFAKQRYGFYVLFHFRGEPALLAELDRSLKLNESILRFMTVQLDERHKISDHIVDVDEDRHDERHEERYDNRHDDRRDDRYDNRHQDRRDDRYEEVS